MESLKNFEDRAPRDAAIAAYDALAQELRKLRSIEQLAQELERSSTEAPAAVAAAEKAVRVAFDEQLRGLGTADDAKRARERVTQLQERAAEAREQLSLARLARDDAETRIRAAKATAQRAREAQSAQLFDAIAAAIRDDSKLRRRLVLAFAATCLTNDRDVGVVGRVDWCAVINEIFPWPDDAEIEAAIADGAGRFPRLALATEAVTA